MANELPDYIRCIWNTWRLEDSEARGGLADIEHLLALLAAHVCKSATVLTVRL